MDYGDRQERAEMLIKTFRAQGSKIIQGSILTGEQVADEIENMTEYGKNLVAVAGLVLHAIAITPEFFGSKLG
jgi:hypothetical protein